MFTLFALLAAGALPSVAAVTIPGALAWLIGGGLLRTVATAAIVAPLAFGVGYWRGYSSANDAANLATLQLEIDNREKEDAARRDADGLAGEQASANATAESETEKTATEVEKIADAAPEVPNCVTADFLRGLRKLP